LKKLIFLVVGALLVLGLVLPGCTGEGPTENIIKIAVCGPFTDLQGQNAWDGANMAVDELGSVTINGTEYDLQLVKVETQESTEGEDGTTGSTNLEAVIDDVAFCVGGFRTEVVTVYREVAMDAEKLFMNCGAATGALQFSVVTDYDNYKYWFKATPYNESFLVKSCLKMTATIGNVLKGTLFAVDGSVDPLYKVSTAVGGKLRVEILMEDAAWCAGMVPAAQYYLPLLGFNVTGTNLVSPTDTDISDVLSGYLTAGHYPHMIFTAFSGSVGAVYSVQKNSLGIPAMTIGINVPGQQLSHWANTGGSCKGEVMLDTWAYNVSNTPTTVDWFNDYVAQTGRYPVYTAGTYDAIMNVCHAIEDLGTTDSDALVAWLEDPSNAFTTGVSSAKVMYYPMPEVEITPGELYGLTETQVGTIYDLGSYGKNYTASEWLCGFASGVQQPHIAHDIAYGPGLVTGIGSQWQDVGGSGKKVGVWPMNLGAVPSLVDQYGNWSFQYDGTMPLYIDITAFF